MEFYLHVEDLGKPVAKDVCGYCRDYKQSAPALSKNFVVDCCTWLGLPRKRSGIGSR